ncbi:energy-coupling factor ABC transporter ATP-binding protein [Lacrimispora xylanisolvens]|uniref:energy-coupling factor ABC transporter ATP-binding protein n=1 Tax=Lacrimispora xylanisolvens TaxID=384636 RepID=UPI0024029819
MAFIEVKGLKYKYPHTSKLVLDGIDFEADKGQFIGIIGENQAGKSTLCQAFAGLVPTMFRGAYGGKVIIDGVEASKVPIAVLCQKVGLVFQNPFNQLSGAKDTVFEEIAFGLQNLGIPREEIGKRVDKALKLLDIIKYKDRNPFDLSGGQIQRVAIASILAMEPEVLVLDEPTSQLDPQGSEDVFLVVEKLAKTGITIIMVEQKMEKLAAYCDKILLLHRGSQVAYDVPERIFSRDDLRDFGVEPPVYTQVSKALSVYRKEGGRLTLSGNIKTDTRPQGSVSCYHFKNRKRTNS